MVRLSDRPDMSLDVNRGRKTTSQQQQITCPENIQRSKCQRISEWRLLVPAVGS